MRLWGETIRGVRLCKVVFRRWMVHCQLMSKLSGAYVTIVGAGPAGLAACEILAEAGVSVSLHDRMPNPARKFLLAGRGGLNLTHSEPLGAFLSRYGAAREHLSEPIHAFTPADLRSWCESLGVPTFVGSSGRVFPTQMKASPLLRAWLARLQGLGVKLRTRSVWTGWRGNALVFVTPDGQYEEQPDAAIFALGGASWPRLGSDGSWRQAFIDRGAEIAPFRPSNCGFLTAWSEVFRSRSAGHPLKQASFRSGGCEVRGEAIITSAGIEGGAVYALSSILRETILATGDAMLEIDLAPDLTLDQLTGRLGRNMRESISNRLRKAGISATAAGLLREDEAGPDLPQDAALLAQRIKKTRVRLTGIAPIDRAISTAGGVTWGSLRSDFALKSDPRSFVAGEMLDWEAPTGGYLLQACFATGRAAARGALACLADRRA